MTTLQRPHAASDVHAGATYLQLVFHNDQETPEAFVVELLRSVFNKPITDAIRFAATIDRNGKAICGIYPRGVADGLLEVARERIRATGHPLLITSQPVAEDSEMLNGQCKLCGVFSSENRLSLKGTVTLICDDCIG